MAKIKMVRIDYRMVHGQIVAKWIKFRPVDRLILADDALVDDSFMGDIYKMAVPQKDVDIVKLTDIQYSDVDFQRRKSCIYRNKKWIEITRIECRSCSKW